MSLTDKLPSTTETLPAVPAAPTEGAGTDAAKQEALKKVGEAHGARVDLAEAAAPAVPKSAEISAPPVEKPSSTNTPTAAPAVTPSIAEDLKKGTSGWAAFMSSLSSGWSNFSKWFDDAGGKIGEWIGNLLGIKKGGEGVDPDKDKDNKDKETGTDLALPERAIEDSEMLTSNAPVFTFNKGFSGDPHVSDVPCIRPIHPVTFKHNVPHRGVDIPAPDGTPFYATQPMTIVSAGPGNLKCRLEDGKTVSFLHVSKIASFKAGEKVPRGTWLANTGNVGGSTGPHLHFGVNDGKTIDAVPYLDAGLMASAEKKIQEKKTDKLWIPLESDAYPHGLA
ncbi:MAG: peptidoglycan DD-metalloendopeptidase family protein [Candidatus Gracilibacteria bacterium]